MNSDNLLEKKFLSAIEKYKMLDSTKAQRHKGTKDNARNSGHWLVGSGQFSHHSSLTTHHSVSSHQPSDYRPLVIAVSGGADSVCLLHLFNIFKDILKVQIIVAHLNHSIRGKTADADAKFVKSIAKKYNNKFFYKKLPIKTLAKRSHFSIEQIARKERYAFLNSIASKVGAEKIAVAHNYDDNVETILFRLIRGTSPDSIASGIQPVNNKIIRPLIEITKEEILDYCSRKKLDFRTDVSNFDTKFIRNKIRNVLLPFLEKEFNPNVKESITRFSALLKEDSEYLESLAENYLNYFFSLNKQDVKKTQFSQHEDVPTLPDNRILRNKNVPTLLDNHILRNKNVPTLLDNRNVDTSRCRNNYAYSTFYFSLDELKKIPIPILKRLLRTSLTHILNENAGALEYKHIEQLINLILYGKENNKYHLPANISAGIENGKLYFEKTQGDCRLSIVDCRLINSKKHVVRVFRPVLAKTQKHKNIKTQSIEIKLNKDRQENRIAFCGQRYEFLISRQKLTNENKKYIFNNKNNFTAYFDYEKVNKKVNAKYETKNAKQEDKKIQRRTTNIGVKLKLRGWNVGDYFYPLGTGGRKKLSDFFTDQKIPQNQRDKIPLLIYGNEILWVVGYRIDDRFKVDSNTNEILKIDVKQLI